MSIEEMKKNILSKIEMLTEQQFMQLNNYLDLLDQDNSKEYALLPHAEAIVKEREEVLKKLAQNYDTIKAQYGDVLQKLAQ